MREIKVAVDEEWRSSRDGYMEWWREQPKFIRLYIPDPFFFSCFYEDLEYAQCFAERVGWYNVEIVASFLCGEIDIKIWNNGKMGVEVHREVKTPDSYALFPDGTRWWNMGWSGLEKAYKEKEKEVKK